jgi:hypothetical protein
MMNRVLMLGVAGSAVALAGLIGTLVVAVPADAQEMVFMTVDADGDGAATFSEMRRAGWRWSENTYADADRDDDGILSADEFVSATGT